MIPGGGRGHRRRRAPRFDWRARAKTEVVGYPVVGRHQLAKQCGGGRYVHWGATTQDIMDTALVLQMRDALALVGPICALARPCRARRSTATRDGRPHAPAARPADHLRLQGAVWLGCRPPRGAPAELRPRILAGNSAGRPARWRRWATGLAVHERLAELGLGRPPDALACVARRPGRGRGVLGLVSGKLAKIATDIVLMMQTEVGEAFEPYQHGRGASSTMPQKRNPIACEYVAWQAVRQQAGLLLDAMARPRAGHGALATRVARAAGNLHRRPAARCARRAMLEGMIVDTARMRRNLEFTRGLILAEAVMMALAEHTGRQDAHHVVAEAWRAALQNGTMLLAELEKRPDVTKHLDAKRLAELTNPANYLGSAAAMVDRVLASEDSLFPASVQRKGEGVNLPPQ